MPRDSSHVPIRLLAVRPLCSPGFTRDLLRDLKIAQQFEPREILYLTPNKRRARTALFEISSFYHQDALQVPSSMDIQTLARELVLSRGEKGIVDEGDRRFILLKLIGEGVGDAANLDFREEHLGLLSHLYAELKRYHPVNWEEIPDRSQEVVFDADTRRRLEQAVALLTQYERNLAQQQLVDHEGLLAEAAQDVDYLPYKLLIIEGYFEPWVSEQGLFRGLLNHIPNAVVIIPDDPLAVKGERFFSEFELSRRPSPEPVKPPSSSWRSYPSREAEVKAIARHICSLAQKGVNPRDIMVVFPALGIYRPIVARVFARYGLKPDISIRPALASFPGIRTVLDLIHTAHHDFRRRDVVGLLLASCFTGVPQPVRKWIDVLSREEGIIAGAGAWISAFLSRVPWRMRDYPQATLITNQVRNYVKDFINKLKILVRPSSVSGFCDKLKNILDWLGWKVAVELRRGFEESLEKFQRMAELAGEARVSPGFVTDTLEILLKREISETGDERDKDSIRVVPLVESRWLDTGHLFVGGMVDGEFPRRPYRDLLLPEKLRDELGFPTVDFEFNNASFEFRRLNVMARERILFSAPSAEGDRPLLTSIFFTERDEDEAECDEVIYCSEELQLVESCKREKPQEGVEFTDRESLQLLGNRYTSAYPFRVTVLELYRACPYRHYLRAVLGIEPYEEPTFEPEGRLLGMVLHDALERVFKKSSDADNIEDRLWSEVIFELDRRRLNPFVRLWIEDWVKARKDWFASQETMRVDEGWKVGSKWLERSLEMSFEEEGFRLKGRIDRVDWREKRARVIDYKTGQEKNFLRDIDKGISIQLPLYSEMIRRAYGAQIDSFGIYNFAGYDVNLVTSPEAAITSAVGFASRAISGIRQGRFASQPDQHCRYCEYSQFCGSSV